MVWLFPAGQPSLADVTKVSLTGWTERATFA
jgi:hypothetical protein